MSPPPDGVNAQDCWPGGTAFRTYSLYNLFFLWMYVETFSVSKTLTLSQEHLCVENECCFPSTVNISNVNFTSKISIPPEPVFTKMGQQMLVPDNWNGKNIRHESEGWGFESPSGRDILCLKKVDTFKRTPVRVSKINTVARAQLTFQNVNVTSKLYMGMYVLSSVKFDYWFPLN